MKNQQDALYRAQTNVCDGAPLSLDGAQQLVDAWREKPWWPVRVQRVEVGPARSRIRSIGWYDATCNAGRIELAVMGRTTRTLVHELAHVFAGALHDSTSHDPFFARIYGELIFRVMGSDAWLQLEEGYKREGVEYRA